MKTKAQVLAEVERIVDATPDHCFVCPPLSRALMTKIAEQLKIVSRETKPEDRPKPKGGECKLPLTESQQLIPGAT